jgi:hypothetical protein
MSSAYRMRPGFVGADLAPADVVPVRQVEIAASDAEQVPGVGDAGRLLL